jgi:hypothetical protein
MYGPPTWEGWPCAGYRGATADRSSARPDSGRMGTTSVALPTGHGNIPQENGCYRR